ACRHVSRGDSGEPAEGPRWRLEAKKARKLLVIYKRNLRLSGPDVGERGASVYADGFQRPITAMMFDTRAQRDRPTACLVLVMGGHGWTTSILTWPQSLDLRRPGPMHFRSALVVA